VVNTVKPVPGKRLNGIAGALNILLLTLFALMCVYPLYYILINSFSSPAAVTRGVFLVPLEFSVEAYDKLKAIPGIGSSVVVSAMRTVVGSLLTMAASSFVAYLLTHKDMPARKFLYRFFIVTMYIGAGFIPYYLLISNIGLKNNFLVYVLPSAVSAYFIILIKTYIESIPAAMHESAEIDGAGILTIYLRIVLPLSKPILACIIVFAAVNQWNSWADDMFFMQGSRARNLHVLQFLLYQNLQSNMSAAVSGGSAAAGAAIKVTPQTLRMAMTFVTVLPILCVYPFMQRYFTKGIMLGAVKG
jgi:ABC-type glycerol-3-phosphate transport system permease component